MPQLKQPTEGRVITISREGYVWLFASFLLLIVGVSKNINLLSLLGCMMACLLGLNLLLPLWRAAFGPSTLRVCGTPVVGIRHPIEILIHPLKPIPYTFQVILDEPNGQTSIRWNITGLSSGPGFIDGHWYPATRGWNSLGPLEVHSRYPFGLVSTSIQLAGTESFLVHPATSAIHWDPLLKAIPWRPRDRRNHLSGSRLARHRPFAQEEFHAMRGFRPGDSPRLIHWRTSARRGMLIIREFEDPPNRELVLEFDPIESPEGIRESAISFVASFLHGWFQQGHGKLSVRFCGQSPLYLSAIPDAGTLNRALDWLAEWNPGDSVWPATNWTGSDSPASMRVGTILDTIASPADPAYTLAVDLTKPDSLEFWNPDGLGARS